MFNNNNQNEYNRISYLKMVDIEISKYKRDILFKMRINTDEEYRNYFDNYHPYLITLIKTWNNINSYF